MFLVPNPIAVAALKVMCKRLKDRVEENVKGIQVGFRERQETGNAILVLRTIVEGTINEQNDLCFVYFEKRSI